MLRVFASFSVVAALAVAAPADDSSKSSDSGKSRTPVVALPTPSATAVPVRTPAPTPSTDAPAPATDKDKGSGDSEGDAGDSRETPESEGSDDQREGAQDELPPASTPVAGETVTTSAASGTVKVRVPGGDGFVELAADATVPVGSVVDASAGKVVLQTALPGGRADSGTFWGGVFEVRQGKDGVTELRLRGGSFAACGAGRSLQASTSGKRKRKTTVRRLWGSDHGGRFRSRGRNSVATVRGTRWLTEDRCDGTLTRVAEGAVDVRDSHTGRSVLLHAGESYVAKRRPAASRRPARSLRRAL